MTQPQPQPLDVDAIEQRANAAEDGWHIVRDTEDVYRFTIQGDGPTDIAVFGGDPDNGSASYLTEENATFAAHARADVPALVAEIRRLRAELTEARDQAIVDFCYGDAREVLARHRDQVLTEVAELVEAKLGNALAVGFDKSIGARQAADLLRAARTTQEQL